MLSRGSYFLFRVAVPVIYHDLDLVFLLPSLHHIAMCLLFDLRLTSSDSVLIESI